MGVCFENILGENLSMPVRAHRIDTCLIALCGLREK